MNIRQSAIIAIMLGWTGLGLFATQKQGSIEVSSGELIVAPLPPAEVYPHTIKSRTTLFSSLRELNVSAATIYAIVDAAKPVYDLTRIRAGSRFQLFHNPDHSEVIGIKFRFSPVELLEIRKQEASWVANKITEKVDSQLVTFSGVVNSTLWESAERAKMDTALISELAEIFAWQVDFAREVRLKDRWRISVEQKFVRGEPIGWGSILAAEYENSGTLHQAVLFRMNGEDLGYFAPDGSSLKKMFLKSPIPYGRISSRFQKRRFHPILQVHRPHLGVDYAAPKGTPVRSVGDGVVTFAGWSGGGGKIIKVRHNSTYQTAYKHLNGYANGIRSGARVRQGQIIGYVGNTGMSTAPHLHFEFFQGGRYVDPLGRKFPSADPVPKVLMTQFQSDALPLLDSLPSWKSLEVSLNEEAPAAPKASN